MRRHLFTFSLLLIVGVLGFAVAGCGGSSSSAPSAQTAGPATTEATEETVATEETATTEETSEPATTEETATTAEVSTVASATECRELANLATDLAKAIGGTPGTDVDKTAKFLTEFANRVPADIRDDFKVIADTFQKYAEALKGVDLSSGKPPSPDVIAKLQQLGQQINQAKLTAASQHIQAWIQANCH